LKPSILSDHQPPFKDAGVLVNYFSLKLQHNKTITMQDEWFLKWFNSPYYDLLYRHRTEDEAKVFLDKLLHHLNPSTASLMLDLACGNGRFSHYLALKGFDVTGLDISDSKINEAINKAEELKINNVEFYKHDMRSPFRQNYFDYVFNFFTSFGYFEKDIDHLRTIENIFSGLKPGGTFILDYLNSIKTISNLKEYEEQIFEGIPVIIKRSVENGFIQKRIELHHRNKDLIFTEKVRAFDLSDLNKMLNHSGFLVKEVFGNYDLDEFNAEKSDRLIIEAVKA